MLRQTLDSREQQEWTRGDGRRVAWWPPVPSSATRYGLAGGGEGTGKRRGTMGRGGVGERNVCLSSITTHGRHIWLRGNFLLRRGAIAVIWRDFCLVHRRGEIGDKHTFLAPRDLSVLRLKRRDQRGQ